ncbi:RcnB family protein [Brevundimonas sp.]|uniref:RcnB family protein n=1 Tax=Brevundimonas sp. TaxID=1871086 RepID=UPI002D568AC6|nr:RcnB family protein [Brevundimonas sp.]HYC68659.1 RcnB family protein [Brevundimonas sp.]
MMKPLMIGALSLVLATPTIAEAQSWRGDRDRDGRYERWERRADQNRRDGRGYTRRERERDWRRYQRDQRRDWRQDRREYRREMRRWRRGAVIPYDYRRNWYVRDYHRYGWAPPPRGYGYYRTDTGDIVLAAIATGVILSLLD